MVVLGGLAVAYERGTPILVLVMQCLLADAFWLTAVVALRVRFSTQGSSWGYLKVNSSETLSFFGDKCSQNGSKNDLMAPRTTLECFHEGPSVVAPTRYKPLIHVRPHFA